jgi:hypothetical protein
VDGYKVEENDGCHILGWVVVAREEDIKRDYDI